jgi:anti-sigma regulatory factor (Ser/Thr protein kinase)
MRPHHTVPLRPTRDAPPAGRFPADLVGPFEVTLAAAVDAPGAARAAVTAWMAGHVDEMTLADVQLLAVELVANSVRHADTPADAAVRVWGEIRGDALRLEVEDRGSGGSIARRAADLQHGGGFGLNVVEALSRRWGVDRDAGTRVWAEIGIRVVACDPAERGPAMPTRSNNGDSRHDAASAPELRAESARRRGVAARGAGERPATESAARGHLRVVDLHDAMAHDTHSARTHRLGGSDPDAA